MSDQTIILDIHDDINMFRLLSLRGRLHLESNGLRFRQATAPAVRKELNSKTRSKIALLKELEDHIEKIMGTNLQVRYTERT